MVSGRDLIRVGVLITLLIKSLPVLAHRSPIGEKPMDWTVPGISRVHFVQTDYRSGAGIYVVGADPRIERRHGRTCLVGGYFLMDVDDEAFGFDLDEPVTLTLTLDAQDTDGVLVGYDKSGSPARTLRNVLDKENAEPLTTITIELERARFAGRLNLHTDLAIGAIATNMIYRPGSLSALVLGSPADWQTSPTITLCDLKLERQGKPSEISAPQEGRLKLRVLDDQGRPEAVRVGLYDASGRMPLPTQAAIPVDRYGLDYRSMLMIPHAEQWPGKNRYGFYVYGDYETDLSAGDYQLVASKGFEYHVIDETITVPANGELEKNIVLQRWTDMPQQGWYSGDDHIHIARPRPQNRSLMSLARAEDLHIASLTQASSLTDISYRQFAFGAEGHENRSGSYLVAGQEAPRSSLMGHILGLNGTSYVHHEDFYMYHQTAKALRDQGALYGYTHVSHAGSPMGLNGSVGVALDLPFGDIDFLSIQQMGFLGAEFYYDVLNLGFRIPPSAGTDFPYYNLPGAERVYAYTGSEFSVEAWFAALAAGKSFVTNGPLVSLKLNGQGPGATIELEKGAPVQVEASARLNPGLDRLGRLELVKQGEVIAKAESEEGAERLQLVSELNITDSGWVSLRAYGRGGSEAMTAPIYLIVDGDTFTGHRQKLPGLVDTFKGRIEALRTMEIDPAFDGEGYGQVLAEKMQTVWQDNRQRLQSRIDKAHAYYDQLLEREAR